MPGSLFGSDDGSATASELAEEFPAVTLDSDALEAVNLLAEHGLPGIVVCDRPGHPHAVLPSSQVVRFLVPGYIQDDPSPAGVLSESLADRIAEKFGGVTVRKLLGDERRELARVNADDTILEVAAIMARIHSPLVAVMDGERLVGVHAQRRDRHPDHHRGGRSLSVAALFRARLTSRGRPAFAA